MTVLAVSGPTVPARMRIAITSPDILARIRQVFAGRNLAVDFVCPPSVEVVVRPAPGAAPAAGPVDRLPAPRRLVAEYQLVVVGTTVGSETAPAVPGHGIPEDPGAHQDTGAGSSVLSHRQHDVMALISQGARNAEIAERLGVREKTVRNHITRIFRSLGATNRVEAILIWSGSQPSGGWRSWRSED